MRALEGLILGPRPSWRGKQASIGKASKGFYVLWLSLLSGARQCIKVSDRHNLEGNPMWALKVIENM